MSSSLPLRWISRNRDDILLAILIAFLASAVFVFFKTFFDATIDPLTTEILAALLGTILTVLITMLLIKRQGTIEQAQEAAATNKTQVFERKLELFRQFISIYTRSALDGELDPKELGNLEELALTITLFVRSKSDAAPSEDLGENLCQFVFELEAFGLDAASKVQQPEMIRRYYPQYFALGREPTHVSFTKILQLMKKELGLEQTGFADDEDGSDPEKGYFWAEQLLCYRDYQSGCDASAEPQRVATGAELQAIGG